jgi:hypothetical protein
MMSSLSYFTVELHAKAKNLEIEFESCAVHNHRWNVKVSDPTEDEYLKWELWDAPVLWTAVLEVIANKVSSAVTDMLSYGHVRGRL